MLERISLRRVDEDTDLTTFNFPDNLEEMESKAAELDGAHAASPDPSSAVSEMAVDPEIARMLQSFVYQLGLVDNIDQVDAITSAGKGAFPSVYKIAMHQRWCFNHGEEHTSNRVYLMVACFFFFLRVTFFFLRVTFFFLRVTFFFFIGRFFGVLNVLCFRTNDNNIFLLIAAVFVDLVIDFVLDSVIIARYSSPLSSISVVVVLILLYIFW